jgi:O-antigen/teichoic acid export membrane protein
VNIAVSITLAFMLRNVWALVWGAISGAFVIFIMSYVLQPYRPRLAFRRAEAGVLLDFGKWLLGSSILGFCLMQGDDVFVGRLLGVVALGFYQMAYRFSNAPATEITHVISQVTFPVYSKIQNDIPRLRKAYLDVLKLTTFLSFPLAGLILVLAPDFTRIFLGEKWMPMVSTMQVLSIFGLIRSIEAIAGPLFQAIGKPNIIVRLQLVKLFLLVVMIYPLTKYFGIVGTALTVILSNALVTPFTNLIVIKNIRATVAEFLKPLIFFTVATVFAALLVWTTKSFVLVGRFDIAVFFILGATGLAFYYFLIFGVYRVFSYQMPTKALYDYLFSEKRA